MTTTWADIPREILEIVFKKLKREYFNTDYDLRECSLVCHRWAPAAQEILFSTINLKSEKDVEKLIYTVARKPSLAGFVKTLDYNYNELTSYTHIAHLAILANFFPHLEEFDANGFIEDSFYEMFCDLVRDGRFPFLKEFPKSRNTYQDSLRASCMIAHCKNSITEIKLFRHDDTGRNEFKLICDELHQFPRLNKFEITVISEVPQSVIQYIESVTLTSAKKLDFTMDFPETSTLNEHDLKKIQPMLQVKKFYGSLWRRLNIDYADFILYLMRKFPNLDDLKLTSHDYWRINLTGPDSAKLISTPILVDQFFKYLSKMSDFLFQYCYIDANDLVILIEQYINIINSQKKALIHLNLTPQGNRAEYQTIPFVNIDLCRSKKTINEISLKLYLEDYDSISSSFLESLGSSFDTMTLDTNSTNNIIALLERVSKSCPNLKSLGIRGDVSLEPSNVIQTSCQGHHQLKELILYHDSPSELFPFVSQQFPCIESLKIHKSHSSEDDEIRAYESSMNQSDPSTNEIMENCKITYLDMLDFSVKHLTIEASVDEYNYEARLKHVYIKIITHNDGKTRYCHILAPDPTEEYPKKEQTFTIAENPTEDEYQDTIGGEYYLHYEITCNSLEKITMIEYPINFDNLIIEFSLN